ncbi:alpha-D-ribose 1-methylphosphonate 5-triphosphate diphosphatase [Microvirga tunisiensis]|uniref:Alpha-D-ribose 1-methylphosphonate 5-triphosphate diphosphatase n=2 Tax=Pannonibacter tanglangensis TaxID=2750084 RepID=A0ABW9ZQ57_9HYPH|nr:MULTISPECIES: alpha-D-ribose 1-methylphosphonate 5-triphosphate diphosphatase [unclassified Pannonibacter]NBN65192.1 alpha-D-ribose 1-methylphosphonate 5-triphosphate diphosphatase [Pannonibacter sp. XCT-34]NBN79831.1 alpha-D-ribose 1-methylphosphonate 5-triphosphate diphosphatase [Pannonibacter sp. XCT-53]
MTRLEHPVALRPLETVFDNARLVLADRVVDGHLVLRDGQIAEIGEGRAPAGLASVDLEGDYLLPGLVDIHTDHLEKHVFPRAHVKWNPLRAALAHDSQIIGAGITTVFDSLCVGATVKNPERLEILAPMIDALEQAQAAGMMRAEHLVHLRCEIVDTHTPALTEANISRDIVRIVSVMEHLPGRRQSRDVEAYINRRMAETGHARRVVEQEMADMLAVADGISASVRPAVIALAKAHGKPLLSHDDTELAHIDEAVADGILISEFPCTIEAARYARDKGMLNVGGAPNILRGGSQSGNVAMGDLLAEGILDLLASDYVPRSMLDAAFLIGLDTGNDARLAEAIRLVSKAPAAAAGLADRGEIAAGLRGDLLQVRALAGHPVLRRVWREGSIVH